MHCPRNRHRNHNDFGLADLAQTRAAAMVIPDLKTLVAQAGDVLGAWGATLEQTRELRAVRLGADGALLEQREWDGAALSAGWTLEQGWSPSTRGGYFSGEMHFPIDSVTLFRYGTLVVKVAPPGEGAPRRPCKGRVPHKGWEHVTHVIAVNDNEINVSGLCSLA